jgi:hypothetical protein
MATAGGVALLLLLLLVSTRIVEAMKEELSAEILASSGIAASVELFLVAWLPRAKTAVSVPIRVQAEGNTWP